MNVADTINDLKAYADFYKQICALAESAADGDYLQDQLWSIIDNFDAPELPAEAIQGEE